MTITATLQVQFQGANKNGILQAEIDSRPEGYNGGRTSFSFGDEPVILVRKGKNVNVVAIKTSIGTVSQIGTGFTSEEDFLSYYNTKTQNTNKPVSKNLVTLWYGRNLGPIKLVGDNEIVINVADAVTEPGVLGLTYDCDFVAYKLTGIPAKLNGKSAFSVLVVFVGEVVEA